jgi:peptide/nickel transport system ATP-binding protein
MTRCFRWQDIVNEESSNGRAQVDEVDDPVDSDQSQVLEIKELSVHFPVGRSLGEFLGRQPGESVRAVDGVSLRLDKGQTLGVVGESGSGKTTLARAIVGLAMRTDGEIELLGLDLPANLSERSNDLRKLVQYIFQNPDEALNPYMTIGQTLRRPFIKLLNMSGEEADAEVENLLQSVRLPASYAERLPSQLSGGEKQRAAIARSFATRPDLLIADEPVSSLDVSVQASILNLLGELQSVNQNTLIFISHDLAVVAYLANIVAVLYAGKIMELATADCLFQPPFHPYTEGLLSAIPSLDPLSEQKVIRLQGDVPSQMKLPSGCPFHPRCPRIIGDICRNETPPWRETEKGARIFCHIPLRDLEEAQLTQFKEGARQRR